MIFPYDPIDDYALLDCGDGEKLERFGDYVLRRPDPQAMWRPGLDAAAWDRADLTFVRESDRGGRWQPGARAARTAPESWTIGHRGATLVVRPTPFKHVGLFPEQSTNWAFTAEQIAARRATSDERPALLNLFAYTGAATVLATRAGAFVTHVDASRPALRWAKDNARASDLAADAVRWIEDDAAGFVRRELRRGRRYAGILLDPPPYGRGPRSEKWVFEEHIVDLLDGCRQLLDDQGPAFVVLSCYAVGSSPLAFANVLTDRFGSDSADAGRHVQAGELALPGSPPEGAGPAPALPAGLCGRWWRS